MIGIDERKSVMMCIYTSKYTELIHKLEREIDEALKCDNIQRARELNEEMGNLYRREYEEERAEYLEVFGIDIDRYDDFSYRLLNLKEGRKRKAMAEVSK